MVSDFSGLSSSPPPFPSDPVFAPSPTLLPGPDSSSIAYNPAPVVSDPAPVTLDPAPAVADPAPPFTPSPTLVDQQGTTPPAVPTDSGPLPPIPPPATIPAPQNSGDSTANAAVNTAVPVDQGTPSPTVSTDPGPVSPTPTPVDATPTPQNSGEPTTNAAVSTAAPVDQGTPSPTVSADPSPVSPIPAPVDATPTPQNSGDSTTTNAAVNTAAPVDQGATPPTVSADPGPVSPIPAPVDATPTPQNSGDPATSTAVNTAAPVDQGTPSPTVFTDPGPVSPTPVDATPTPQNSGDSTTTNAAVNTAAPVDQGTPSPTVSADPGPVSPTPTPVDATPTPQNSGEPTTNAAVSTAAPVDQGTPSPTVSADPSPVSPIPAPVDATPTPQNSGDSTTTNAAVNTAAPVDQGVTPPTNVSADPGPVSPDVTSAPQNSGDSATLTIAATPAETVTTPPAVSADPASLAPVDATSAQQNSGDSVTSVDTVSNAAASPDQGTTPPVISTDPGLLPPIPVDVASASQNSEVPVTPENTVTPVDQATAPPAVSVDTAILVPVDTTLTSQSSGDFVTPTNAAIDAATLVEPGNTSATPAPVDAALANQGSGDSIVPANAAIDAAAPIDQATTPPAVSADPTIPAPVDVTSTPQNSGDSTPADAAAPIEPGTAPVDATSAPQNSGDSVVPADGAPPVEVGTAPVLDGSNQGSIASNAVDSSAQGSLTEATVTNPDPLIAQAGTPISPLNAVSDASPAGVIDSNPVISSQQDLGVNAQATDPAGPTVQDVTGQPVNGNTNNQDSIASTPTSDSSGLLAASPTSPDAVSSDPVAIPVPVDGASATQGSGDSITPPSVAIPVEPGTVPNPDSNNQALDQFGQSAVSGLARGLSGSQVPTVFGSPALSDALVTNPDNFTLSIPPQGGNVLGNLPGDVNSFGVASAPVQNLDNFALDIQPVQPIGNLSGFPDSGTKIAADISGPVTDIPAPLLDTGTTAAQGAVPAANVPAPLLETGATAAQGIPALNTSSAEQVLNGTLTGETIPGVTIPTASDLAPAAQSFTPAPLATVANVALTAAPFIEGLVNGTPSQAGGLSLIQAGLVASGPVGALVSPLVGLINGIGAPFPGDAFHGAIVKTESQGNRYTDAYSLLGQNEVTDPLRAQATRPPNADNNGRSDQSNLDNYTSNANGNAQAFYQAAGSLDQKTGFLEQFDPRPGVSPQDKLETYVDFGGNKDLANQFGYDRNTARAFSFNADAAKRFNNDPAAAAAASQKYSPTNSSFNSDSGSSEPLTPQEAAQAYVSSDSGGRGGSNNFLNADPALLAANPILAANYQSATANYQNALADTTALQSVKPDYAPKPTLSGNGVIPGYNDPATTLRDRPNDVAPASLRKPLNYSPVPPTPIPAAQSPAVSNVAPTPLTIDANAAPTAAPGADPALQTQINENNPGNFSNQINPTDAPSTNSDTLVTQADTQNSPVNVVSDASSASPVDPNSATPPQQFNVEVNAQTADPNVQPANVSTATTDGNITPPTDNVTFTNTLDTNGAFAQGTPLASDNQTANPDAANFANTAPSDVNNFVSGTPLAPDTNVAPTTAPGENQTLQTQVNNPVDTQANATNPGDAPNSGTLDNQPTDTGTSSTANSSFFQTKVADIQGNPDEALMNAFKNVPFAPSDFASTNLFPQDTANPSDRVVSNDLSQLASIFPTASDANNVASGNDTASPDSGNPPLAATQNPVADPTAVQGDVPTLQTQVSNNIPDSGAPTSSTVDEGSNVAPTAQDNATNSGTPQNSGTVIAQGDTPTDNAFNPVSDVNPAGPVEPNSDVPPKQLNVEVNKQIGDPNVQPEQAATPPNDAPNPFADTLSKLQTVGGLVGAAASALARQQIPQPIQDAFNAFNKFLASPADPNLVDFADRQNGAVVGLAEGLGLLPDLQIADSGSSTGFSSLKESLNDNPSQAFQESRQVNNTIGFGLPFVLEGGGAGKPPASSPELVPVGPGAGIPETPLVRAPETGPLETRVQKDEGNQGPLQSKNEDPNGNTAGGAGDTPLPFSQDPARQQQVAAEFKDIALGDGLGEGGNKVVSTVQGRDDVAIGVLKPGRPASSIDKEIKDLEMLRAQGLPTVDVIGKTTIDGQSAIVTGRLEQGSKDIVENVNGRAEIVGQSDLLNEKSIEDLTNIRSTLQSKQVKIDDLQFLIGKDGSIVIADPLNVFDQKPSPNNIRTINKLIEAAQGNLQK